MDKPLLLPYPRQLTLQEGSLALDELTNIVIPANHFNTARWMQKAAAERGLSWPIVTSNPAHALALTFIPRMDADDDQSYTLTVGADGIHIEGGASGLFYGAATLKQLLALYGRALPHMQIEDTPDFPVRGVMLDISRDKVPSMDTLFTLIDDLAALKLNRVELYMEHTFAYQEHREVWEHASPLTAEEILKLDRFCKKRFIDLVPNQNSLGHMERWLKHPRYLHMAESPDGFEYEGRFRSASTLDPLDPHSLEFIDGLYAELLPNFSSAQFNVGCDEPWELGQGKSKQAIEQSGGKVYLGWILKLYELVKHKYGRQMLFWGDIIIKYPDLVPMIPKDCIVMEWGYEGNHPFDRNCATYKASGVPFMVCPGTSSWNALVGRTDNAMENLRAAAEAGLKHGAIGYLITDWGDYGHFQPLPVSYLGFAYGAAVSWGYEANKYTDITAALDRFVFQDSAGIMGKLAYDLGNLYHLIGPEHVNGQIATVALYNNEVSDIPQMLERYTRWGGSAPDVSPETLENFIERVDELLAPLRSARMHRSDAALVIREFMQAANLLKHGAKWLLLAQGNGGAQITPRGLMSELDTLMMRQRENWLARNRRGGLEDSMRRLERLRETYRSML